MPASAGEHLGHGSCVLRCVLAVFITGVVLMQVVEAFSLVGLCYWEDWRDAPSSDAVQLDAQPQVHRITRELR